MLLGGNQHLIDFSIVPKFPGRTGMINSWVLLILTIHCIYIYINVITHATPMFVAGICHEYVMNCQALRSES